MLTCLGTFPAWAQEFQVTVDPGFVQLGVTRRATLTVRGPAGLAALHLSTNHGTVGEAREVSAGIYEAEYLPPPASTFPRMAVVAAWAESAQGAVHGFAPLPLWGQGVAVVSTVPKANVTLRIGARDFGPVQADAKGRGEVLVQVPPGATHALHGKKSIDLGLPVVSRIHVLAVPMAVRADVARQVTLRVYSVDAEGAPEAAKVRLAVPKGTVGPVRWLAPGIGEATWAVPALEPATLEVSAWAMGAKGAPASGVLRIASGPAVTAELRADRQTHVAGDGRRLTLRLRVRDAKGRPADDAIVWSADFGALGDTTTIEVGEALAELQLPHRFEGRRAVTVTATAGAAKASATVQLVPAAPHEVRLPAAQPVRARDEATVRGLVVDEWENAVPTPPTVTVELGAALVEPDGDGFLVRYTAPSTRTTEPAALVLELAGVTTTHTIPVVPQPALLTASLKGGYATNLSAVSAPMGGVEVGGWTERFGPHLGLLLEGGVIGSSTTARVEPGTTLNARTTFVPVVASLSLNLRLPRDFWLRPALGGGGGAVFSSVQVGDEPWVSDSGLGAVAQASVQVGVKAGVGGPFLEVRGLFVANPGLATLQGSLFSMTFAGGYAFDVL